MSKSSQLGNVQIWNIFKLRMRSSFIWTRMYGVID